LKIPIKEASLRAKITCFDAIQTGGTTLQPKPEPKKARKVGGDVSVNP